LVAALLSIVLSSAAVAGERHRIAGSRHHSTLVFKIRGVAAPSLVRAYLAVGRYRRTVPTRTARRAVRRRVLKVRLDRALARRLAALPRRKRRATLVIVTRTSPAPGADGAGPLVAGPLTPPPFPPPTATVDSEPPVTSDDVPAAVQNSPRQVTLSSYDQGGGQVAVTGYRTYTGAIAPAKPDPGWQTYDPAAKPVLGHGQRIAYYSTDTAQPGGNEEAVKSSAELVVDSDPPVTSDDVPAAEQDGPWPVTLSVSDPGPADLATTRYRVYSGPTAPAKSDPGWQTYDLAAKPVLGHGQRIAYYSSDTAQPQGNEEAVKSSAELAIAPAAPSGEPMPVGDLPGWRQVFTDDFTTPVPPGSFPAMVSAKWRAYTDGTPDTSGNGTYYPSKVVSVHHGVMDKWIHTEGGVHMVAAPFPRVPDQTQKGQMYGRFAVRFRADPVEGYKTAWLLWPDSDLWPQDGEIDFPEGLLGGTICAFLHHQGATSGSDQTTFCTGATFDPWHTAVIEWAPDTTSFYLDGELVGSSAERIPNTPMYWVLQTETRLSTTPPDAAAGHVYIDWVAIWKPEEG